MATHHATPRLRGFVFGIVSAALTVTAFAACSRDQSAAEEAAAIPILLRGGGNDSLTAMYRELMELFEERYAGRYTLDVEWVPGMAQELRTKFRQLNSAGELPAIVTDLAPEAAFAEQLIENGRLLDLRPYFERDENWQRYAFTESVAYNTRPDGGIYTAPISGGQYIGIFYNTELFAEAGIREFPTTWEAFWDAADALQANGITPISLHTQETGWSTNLMLTTYMARTQAGRDFMEIRYPTDEFLDPVHLEAVEMLRRLFSYSTPDAVGGNYATAANRFSSGETAMIANGPWMIPSFSDPQYSQEGFENVVSMARFPNDLMISNQGAEYGWGVSMDHPADVQAGAVEWIKLNFATPEGIRLHMIHNGALTSRVALTDEQRAALGPVDGAYYDAVAGVEHTIPWFQTQWDPITQNETIVQNLPAYVLGDMTAGEYAQSMVDSARRYRESR